MYLIFTLYRDPPYVVFIHCTVLLPRDFLMRFVNAQQRFSFQAYCLLAVICGVRNNNQIGKLGVIVGQWLCTSSTLVSQNNRKSIIHTRVKGILVILITWLYRERHRSLACLIQCTRIHSCQVMISVISLKIVDISPHRKL